MGSAAAVPRVGCQVWFVVNLERGSDQEGLRTLVAVQVSVASTLASEREAVRVERSLQSIGADGAEIDGTFRDLASTGRGGNPHGQSVTIHKGDVVEISATRLAQRKLCQCDRGYTLGRDGKSSITDLRNGRHTGSWQ